MRSLVFSLVVGAFLWAPRGASPAESETVIHVTARRFAFSPSRITLIRGVPVVLELETADRAHGFEVAGLKIREDIKPGEVTRVRIVPGKAGRFPFRCDVFCGRGHEAMGGEILVVEG
ncbi:MAG TPA: cupredoxin domain-containing protein [Vicinamibacteria bacterium]|jgi:cytochrome c oxidase subunit 2|nr:cupredoxin domain-containing protein [Vicinamibacteria bacterium]